MSQQNSSEENQPNYWRQLAWRGGTGLTLSATLLCAMANPAEAYIDNGDGTVTVEQGDTLWEIVNDKKGVSGQNLLDQIETISELNNLSDPNQIITGQTIKVSQPMSIETDQKTPESTKQYSDAVWIVQHQKHTPWLVSHLSAAINGISQQEALQKILEANPKMVPEELQLGDGFILPDVSQQELERALSFVAHIAKLQLTPAGEGQVPTKTNQAENSSKTPQSPANSETPKHPTPEKPMNTDPKILANQVLEHPNITIEASPNNRVERSIEDATDDGKTFNYDVDRDNQGEIPLSPRLLQTLKFLADKGYKIEITSVTTGHDHVETSNHYKGLAVDIAINEQTGYVFTDLFINREILGLNELILGTPPVGTTNLKHGQSYEYSEEVLRNHDNHIHFSVAGHDPMVDQKQGEFLEIEPDGEVHPMNEEPAQEKSEQASINFELTSEEQALIDNMELEQYQKDFLKNMVIEARKTAQNYRVNPAVMVAQAILESSWGENAAGNNFFGNKADSNWTGPTQVWHTFEYDDQGNRYEIDATFKVFASPEEAFNEYGRMIQDAAWYDDAEANHTNWQAYLHGLVNEPPMYATAPDYEQIVGGIVQQFHLSELTHSI